MGPVSGYAEGRGDFPLHRWPALLLYTAVLLAVVGARGPVLARMLGGRYPIAYLLYDVVTFGMTIAGLRLVDRLVRHAVERWLDAGRRLVPVVD
jgi:hypothetical protein